MIYQKNNSMKFNKLFPKQAASVYRDKCSLTLFTTLHQIKDLEFKAIFALGFFLWLLDVCGTCALSNIKLSGF